MENPEKLVDDPTVVETYVDGVCGVYFDRGNAVITFSRRKLVSSSPEKVVNYVRARMIMPVDELQAFVKHAGAAIADLQKPIPPEQVN